MLFKGSSGTVIMHNDVQLGSDPNTTSRHWPKQGVVAETNIHSCRNKELFLGFHFTQRTGQGK
jgi:hypothetical protein